MYFNKLKYLVKVILFSKWNFNLPESRKVLIIDGENNPFQSYFDKKDYHVLYRRGEEINFNIIFKCIISNKLSIPGYYETYIKFVKPKIILTAFDHYPSFYQLSKKTNIKTAMVIIGKRSPVDGLFATKFGQKKKDGTNFIDYIFVHNDTTAKLYKIICDGKIFATGSFINNIKRQKVKRKKKEILFISNFKPFEKIWTNNPNPGKGILTHAEFQRNDKYVIKSLSDFAKKNKIRLNILARQTKENFQIEKKYFEEIIDGKFNLISKNKNQDSYYMMSKYKYVFTIWSTMGIENLVKNGRTGFIYNKPNNPAWNDARIGVFEKFKKKGPFWTTTKAIDQKEFERVFNKVVYGKEKMWKNLRNNYGKKLLGYDEGNKKFLKIVHDVIKGKL